MPANVQRSIPAGLYDYAHIAEPNITFERFVAFVRSLRTAITPPTTGSAGLLPHAAD